MNNEQLRVEIRARIEELHEDYKEEMKNDKSVVAASVIGEIDGLRYVLDLIDEEDETE